MEAEIKISYKSEGEAEAVASAIIPDNLKAPKGLSIETKRKGFEVQTFIKCKRKLQTFIATIDDLLSCISVAERGLLTIKKKRDRDI